MAGEEVFDTTVVLALGQELGSPSAADHFAAQYLQLLDPRVRNIQWAIAEGEIDHAMDAVLSLKVTSATIGAHALRAHSQHVEQALHQGDLPAATAAAAALPDTATATATAITSFLTNPR